jgi:hypothetical protein
VIGVAGLAAVLHGSPAAADSDAGRSTIHVEVAGAITLTDLTPSFSLTGAPGSVETSPPVSMTITTNNVAGYRVTVEPAGTALAPGTSGNADVISTDRIEVRGPVQGATFQSLDPGTPLLVATRDEASAADGDTVDNLFRLAVPAVRPDTYSGQLNFVVTTL